MSCAFQEFPQNGNSIYHPDGISVYRSTRNSAYHFHQIFGYREHLGLSGLRDELRPFGCQGRALMQTFIDGVELFRQKNLDMKIMRYLIILDYVFHDAKIRGMNTWL